MVLPVPGAPCSAPDGTELQDGIPCTALRAGLPHRGLEPLAASPPPAPVPPQETGRGAGAAANLTECFWKQQRTWCFIILGPRLSFLHQQGNYLCGSKTYSCCCGFSFPNHPLQVLGEGSISFFLFPAHLPIPKTNILEQACGGESILIKPERR